MFTNIKILIYGVGVLVLGVEAGDGFNKIPVDYTGRSAGLGQFPYAVRLYSRRKDSTVTYCTAAIITYSKLLTAGHCCHDKSLKYVVSGDPDQTDFVSTSDKGKYNVHYVRKYVIHPDFERTEDKLVHDLCVLLLEKPLRKKDGHEVIPISYDKLSDKKNCTALGWGTNFGYEIQHRLYYKKAMAYRCNLRFGNSSKYWFVCLEPHSVCPGDSGGPLVCDGKLYGIASFFIGHGDESNPKCEEGVIDYYSELFGVKEFLERADAGKTTRLSCVLPIIFLNLLLLANNLS